MIKVMATAVAALLAGMMVEGARARADEVFVCEGGRLVRATAGELELLKRTDECIARYFGRSVADVETSIEALNARTATPVVPAGRSAAVPARVAGQDTAVTSGTVAEAAAEPARPKLPSDYRNVLLLNPAPGASPYFVLNR
jgi:hypothetical protein